MSGSTPVLLLLSLVSGSWASHFYGGTMTFYPKGTSSNGSYIVVLRYKLAFHSCFFSDTWRCQDGNCGNQTSLVISIVDQESGGDWCQTEGVMIRHVPYNVPFELRLSSCCWITTVIGDISWKLRTLVNLGVRSDTGKANRSPQITVLPLLRVAVNCPRDFRLLAHDPDGDRVECRYPLFEQGECANCTLPIQTIFTLNKTSCTLTVAPTNGSEGNTTAVQLVVEDFPTQSIVLTYNGSQSVRASSFNPLSILPVQFAVRVVPAAPSCIEGLYLPKFMPPTPANGAQLYASVNQTLEITIAIQALISNSTELLFSGPGNIQENSTSPNEFTLRWTPSQDEEGEAHPICFIGQATSFNKYHSELRCVIVTVGNPTVYVIGMRANLSSLVPLPETYISSVVLQQFREEITRQGLEGDFTLRLKAVNQTGP